MLMWTELASLMLYAQLSNLRFPLPGAYRVLCNVLWLRLELGSFHIHSKPQQPIDDDFVEAWLNVLHSYSQHHQQHHPIHLISKNSEISTHVEKQDVK